MTDLKDADRILPLKLPKRPQLWSPDRMRGGRAVLHPRHMDQAGLEVDLFPA